MASIRLKTTSSIAAGPKIGQPKALLVDMQLRGSGDH